MTEITQQTEITTHTLDASDKRLGRFATEVAVLLMGKDRPDFARNKVAPVKVVIENVDAMDISAKKTKEKVYEHYTGYPSGLRKQTLEKIQKDKGTAEVLRKAVYGMLPGNKLRAEMMKNLSIN